MNLWVPFFIGLALLLFALPATLVLPGRRSSQEARKKHVERSTQDVSETSRLLDDPSSMNEPHLGVCEDPDEDPSWPGLFNAIFAHVLGLCASVLQRPKFQILLEIFFLASLASSNSPILVLYVSKRYGWTFARAGYLLSAKAAVNVVVLTFIGPFLVYLASARFGLSPRTINIGAAEVCMIISIVGVLCVGAAVSIAALIAGKIAYHLQCHKILNKM